MPCLPTRAHTGAGTPTAAGALAAAALGVLLATAHPAPAHAAWNTNGNPLTLAAGNQTAPLAISDGLGGAYVAWIDARAGNADVYLQRVLPSGDIAPGWPVDGLPVCTHASVQSNLALAADGATGALLAWVDSRNGTADVFASRVLESGLTAPGWSADGVLVCGAAGTQTTPALTSDGTGGALLVWADARGTSQDLYGMRLLATGSPDPAWAANGSGLVIANQPQSAPAIVGDDAGGAVLAWVDGRRGSTLNPEKDVYALRISAAGTTVGGWPAGGIAVAVDSLTDQDSPAVVRDGSGGAIVVWRDGRSGTRAQPQWDVYASRLRAADGGLVAGWTANGTAVVQAAGSQTSPVAAADGAGGVLIAWQDGRRIDTFPVDTDIFAQRLTADGAVSAGWPAHGFNLSPQTVRQEDPQIVADGAGGALVAWQDLRGSGEIYAQHVSGAGAIVAGFPTDGLLLCNAALQQVQPALVADGAGGAIAAWEDPRLGTTSRDVYALRVSGDGLIGPTVDAPDGRTGPDPAGWGGAAGPVARLSMAGPNPARGSARFMLEVIAATTLECSIYGPAGRRVAELLPNAPRTPGSERLTWDGRDGNGRPAAPGIYWARVATPRGAVTQRFVFLP